MQRTLIVLLLVASVMVAPGTAGAETAGAAIPARIGHADLDGDHISDALEAHLAESDPSELVDVVVTWRGRADEAAAHAAAGPFTITRRFEIIDAFAATMRVGQVRGLARAAGIFRVEQDFQVQVANDDAAATIGTDVARAELGLDGSGVLACVLDTGADAGHEQLDGSKITHWADFIGTGATPYDDHGHGTHVAATLAGDGTGGADAARLAGIAPGASLAIGKVLDGNGSGPESGIIAGIEWCISAGADLGSMSLGTAAGSDGNDALSQAVDAAADDGVPFVVAAGNSGDDFTTVGSPGAARSALTVGAGGDSQSGLRLAYFSSRGPTVDGRNKPDVVAPGMGIVSADAGTTSGYVAMSGTSMATPVTAGTVALALQAAPGLTPAGLKSAIASTALDLGPAGPDPDWGAGYLDGRALLTSLSGSPAGAAFPHTETIAGTVADSGLWTHTFTLTEDDLDGPIAATVLIDGASECVWELLPGWCFASEWSPDLDARLIGPGGGELSISTCPAGTECGPTGHQEILRAEPTTAGTYTIEVWPFAASPNNGTGGAFTIDLVTGATNAPPPPTGSPPNATDDAYGVSEDDTLVVPAPGLLGNDTDDDGDQLTVASHSQPTSGTVTVAADGGFTYTPDADFAGTDSFTYDVSDGAGGTDTATVVVTVFEVNDAPVADAGPDQTVTDADGDGSETIQLDGTGSFDIDDGIASWTWAEGSTTIGAGPSPTVDLAEGSHTITLTVTDVTGAADSDTVVISVEPPSSSGTTVHVADLDASSRTWRRGEWRASLDIAVHDSDHKKVSGALVSVMTDTGELLTCQTSGKGSCSVSTARLDPGVTSVSFEIVGIESADGSYAKADNHDPDGDSDGTTITASPG
jgi:serine protease AprX